MIEIQPRPTSVSFEQYPTGLGIGTGAPRISWRFVSSTSTISAWEQYAYDVEIDHLSGLLEKYHVESAESVLVPWPSKPLQSRARIHVRIRAYGKAKRAEKEEDLGPTEWSPWAFAECALLDINDWVASPITSNIPQEQDMPQRPIYFRKCFNVNWCGKISKARLYITSLGSYRAYINGKRVGDHCLAPGWTSYKHRLNYHVFDVGDLIKINGDNIIAVEVGEGWYATRLGFFGGTRCIYGKDLAVLAQLEIMSDQQETVKISSDSSWKCSPSAIIRSEIYDGELYDAREERIGWNADVSFDDHAWHATRALDMPPVRLVVPSAPPIRVTQVISPSRIIHTKSGKEAIDFGQNIVGKVRIRSLNKPAGSMIRLQHAEVLEDGELCLRPLRQARCMDEIITSGVELQDWSPEYTYHGFRYVQIDGWSTTDESEPLTLSSIDALVMHTDMNRTGWFSCSNEMVNKLHENAVWSMRGNFLSIPSDCPQRDERLGWTGDIQIFCRSANFLYNTAGILGDWLQDLSLEQMDAHGIPPFVIPNALGKLWEGIPQAVWDDVTVLTPWDLYQDFNDIDILQRQYQSMLAWVNSGVRRGPDGLWDSELWQLGDWLDPTAPPEDPGSSRTNGTLVADAYLVHVTYVLSQVGVVLGEETDATRYYSDYLKLKAQFQYKYMAPSGLLVGDTQTALSLALLFSLHDENNTDQIASAGNRLAHLVRLARFRVSTGFVGTPIVTHALTKAGYSQLAYRMLLEKQCPSWLYPITMGATTVWERWDSLRADGSVNPGEMTSFNHYALGSVINWLHNIVAGISQLEPGWRKIRLRPIPGGDISAAHGTFETLYGKLDCKWEIKNGNFFLLDVTIPPNTKALVVFPGETDDGIWVGSGTYTFKRPYTPLPWPPKAIQNIMGAAVEDEFL